MAQSRTPYLQTDETKRFDLAFDFQSRDGTLTIDSLMENVMSSTLNSSDENDKRIVVSPRPGMDPTASFGTPNTAPLTSNVGGIYYWAKWNTYFFIYNNNLYAYVNGVRATYITGMGGLGYYGFCEFQYQNGVISLVVSDGVHIHLITYVGYPTYFSVVTVNVQAQIGGSFHVPTPVFMDGYLFLAKSATADIYNCNLNDPTTWSGAFVTAEMYSDNITALAVNNNFLYAIGEQSIEFFYDVGNAVGTPLQRYPSAVLQFGSPAMQSVVQSDTDVFLIGDTGDGGYQVWMIDGFKPIEISNEAVRMLLKSVGGAAYGTAYVLRYNKQKLYVLNCPYLNGLGQYAWYTLVYSIEEKKWYTWSSGSGNSKTNFLGYYGSNEAVQTFAGNPVKLSANYFADFDGTTIIPFDCNITTSPMDFGNFNRKRMTRFSLLGGEASASNHNTFNISWNDYDYNSTSWTTPRSVNFVNDFPSIGQLGNFRRRAMKISCTPVSNFRLEGAEVDISKGNQ